MVISMPLTSDKWLSSHGYIVRSVGMFSDSDLEQRLSKTDLLRMCSLACVQKYVRSSDYAFYQALVEVLIPDVLRPIPSKFRFINQTIAKTWIICYVIFLNKKFTMLLPYGLIV